MRHILTITIAVAGALLASRNAAAQAIAADYVYDDGLCADTWMGVAALANNANTTNSNDCANIGYGTLGVGSTAVGYAALNANTSGGYNTAVGAFASQKAVTALGNTAVGYGTLYTNTGAGYNTAIGLDSMEYSTTGVENTGVGAYTLQVTTTGSGNSAAGYEAMGRNTTGSNNTAFGASALASNTTGKGNAAQGVNALFSNTTGIRNLGIGSNALYDTTTGGYNIALGFDAGYNVTTGSNNIEIGAAGAAADNNTIQIGVEGTQTLTKIAGIYAIPVSGSAVYVSASGQLGVQASSERFKTDITTMPEVSAKLQRLRPVTFHYKHDAAGALQYGLIAEEVDKVYPELVVRDDSGKIQGVHYEELAPMLLNELQGQQSKIEFLTQQNATQAREIAAIKQQESEQLAAQGEQLQNVQRQLAALTEKLQTPGAVVAQR